MRSTLNKQQQPTLFSESYDERTGMINISCPYTLEGLAEVKKFIDNRYNLFLTPSDQAFDNFMKNLPDSFVYTPDQMLAIYNRDKSNIFQLTKVAFGRLMTLRALPPTEGHRIRKIINKNKWYYVRTSDEQVPTDEDGEETVQEPNPEPKAVAPPKAAPRHLPMPVAPTGPTPSVPKPMILNITPRATPMMAPPPMASSVLVNLSPTRYNNDDVKIPTMPQPFVPPTMIPVPQSQAPITIPFPINRKH